MNPEKPPRPYNRRIQQHYKPFLFPLPFPPIALYPPIFAPEYGSAPTILTR